MGRGQKLCRLEILISPASTASRIPGNRLTRVPWLNSAYSNPNSRTSRNRARPSVWRWEFQQVENEYIETGVKERWRDGVVELLHFIAAPSLIRSQISITRAQHG